MLVSSVFQLLLYTLIRETLYYSLPFNISAGKLFRELAIEKFLGAIANDSLQGFEHAVNDVRFNLSSNRGRLQMSSLINAGKIKRNKDQPLQQDMPYEMRFMDDSYLRDIMGLQEIIIHSLADKEIFRTHPPDYFKDHFQMENSTIGTFTRDGLIAYSVLYFPGEREDNFGADINLARDELNKVVHLATVAVHPDYRGNSLQSRMQGIHLEVARRMGYDHACCMVSPKNRPSLQNIFSHGLIIKALKLKFDSRLRYIMHKNLSCPSIIGPEEIRIKSSDIEGQISLLKRGFLGFRLVELPDGFEVSYGRAWISMA